MNARLFLSLLAPLLLSACLPPPAADARPGYAPRAGSIAVLHRALTIPAGRLAVYLQGGAVVHENDVDQYRPNCRLALAGLSDKPRTVEPDRFRITATRFETETRWQRQPLRVARRGVMLMGEGGPSPEPNVTHFFLQSAQQPSVRKLECSHWVDPVTDAEHLSERQIRIALGDIMSIEPGN